MTSPIEKACEVVGGQTALARAIGIHPQLMTKIVKGDRPLPAKRCIAVEIATNGAVTRYDLRPDIFGEAGSEDLPPAKLRDVAKLADQATT